MITEEQVAELNVAIEQVVEAEVKEEENVTKDTESNTEAETRTDAIAETEANSNSDSNFSEEPTDSVEKKPEKEVKEKVESPMMGDIALTRAVQVGIPISDARLFPTEAALGRAVDAMERTIEAQRPLEKQEEEADPFAGMSKLDPEKFEPEVIEMYDSLLDVVKKQHEEIKNLKTQTTDQTEQSAFINQEAATREITGWFDGQVEKLGKSFSETLGKGDMNSLEQGSSQFAKREAIANRVAVEMAGYNAMGVEAPNRDVLFRDAARLVLGDEYQQIREKKLTSDLSKRSSQHIQRANSRGTKTNQSPLEDTAAMLDAKYNLRG